MTVGFDEPLRLFNLSSVSEMRRYACPCNDTRAVAISPNGRWMAAAGRCGTIRVWDLTTSGGSTDLPSDGRRIRSLAFAPEGGVLAAAGDGPAVRLWRLDHTADSLPHTPEEFLIRPGKAHALAFVSPELLAVGGTSNTIQLWHTGRMSRETELRGHTGAVASLAASEDGSVLVSGGFDATVRVWDLPDPDRVATARIDRSGQTR